MVQERTTSVALRWLQIGKIKKTKLDMALNYANTGTKEVKVKVQVMPTFNNDPTDIDYEDVKLAISASDNQTLEKNHNGSRCGKDIMERCKQTKVLFK